MHYDQNRVKYGQRRRHAAGQEGAARLDHVRGARPEPRRRLRRERLAGEAGGRDGELRHAGRADHDLGLHLRPYFTRF